jgi:hypothetical protein
MNEIALLHQHLPHGSCKFVELQMKDLCGSVHRWLWHCGLLKQYFCWHTQNKLQYCLFFFLYSVMCDFSSSITTNLLFETFSLFNLLLLMKEFKQLEMFVYFLYSLFKILVPNINSTANSKEVFYLLVSSSECYLPVSSSHFWPDIFKTVAYLC